MCLEPIDPSSAVITTCQHIFCSPCLMRCLHMDAEAHCSEEREREETPGDGRCPLCRTELSAKDVVCAPGAHFTCFASTNVQILTAEEVRGRASGRASAAAIWQ